MLVQLDVERVERSGDPSVPAAGKDAHVAADVDRSGVRFAYQPRDLLLRWAVPHDRAGCLARGATIEIVQALEHELRTRAGRVAAVEQPVVETEHRHERVGSGARGLERGMVVHPEVAAEPEQRGHPSSRATAARR